ncbi:transcription factor domain-containing protein [Aspergillus stella-maris]|uniref:transcription factor domain-containing protein n=1 Tax=Aspergillus stella-maris TaxID=1810926 RepID=UPI003CCD7C70
MSQSQWRCALCSTHFTRSEHLRRHLRSHENIRPYECSLCQRTFTRRDAKTRHERTCKGKLSGTNDRLLYQDAQVQPTSNLPLSSGLEDALSQELGDDYWLNMEMPDPSDFAALDWLYSEQLSSDSIISAERLEFLANFTSENGMGTFLAPETLMERQRIIRNEESSGGGLYTTYEAFLNCYTIKPSMLHDSLQDLGPLSDRTFEITHQFHAMVTQKTEGSVVKLTWTANVESKCRSFFTPSNITRFLGYFFSLWYPNCPFVHRPSFNANTAPLALLCVMIVIGACLSPYPEDSKTARMWLDCVEELVFSSDAFADETGESEAASMEALGRKKKCLERLQATYLVCSLQKREGSLEAKTRIRRYRHATMVTLARDIGIASASHHNITLDKGSEAWWTHFAIHEALIRTMTYVFLFDAALTIFHNSPPRMVVSELKMEMACPEACFQAESPEGCFIALKQWQRTDFWRQNLSIAALVKKICQKDLSPGSVDECAKMGSLNLFTAVQSLHSLTFHLQNSLIFESTLVPIKTGLENWRKIWERREPEDLHIPDTADMLWKKVGFISYSPEFWHLARILVDRIKDESDPDTADVAVSNNDSGSTSEAGTRYDHTDMKDLNGLIMEYRRMSLGAV